MEPSSSSSGSFKRVRLPSNGTQVSSCLVDGCNSDLSKGRDYHRRHKVCELHSKTPRVTIRGQGQRFCQQCSRFHSLGEFDEGKRSCRKRLDGHNRRRRKPQPGPLSLNSTNDHQGTKILPFDSPKLSPSATVNSTWVVPAKAHNDTMVYNTHTQLNLIERRSSFNESFSHGYKGGRHNFPFLQHTDSKLPTCQLLLDPNSTPGNGGNSSHKLFSDGLDRVMDSDCARSLLSSSQARTQELGPRHMVQFGLTSLAQPGMQYNGFGVEAESLGHNFPAHDIGGNTNNIHCHELFQVTRDGSSASGPNKTISFSWQ